MKKNELMNGDIVVLSGGCVAVVIGEGEDAYLLHQHGGFEWLEDCYDEDLYNETDEDMVMQVFRSNGGFGFEGVDQEVPIWERDEAWERPSEKEREEAYRIAAEQYEAEFKAAMEHTAEAPKNRISIIVQGFYGNRTGTEIRKENIDRFVLGCLSDIDPVRFPLESTIVRLPGSDSLVLIYNKHQEMEWIENKERALREDNYIIKPLATIPEMNLEIYSRCIVCRMPSENVFESLCEGDYEIWNRYLAI